MAGLARIKDLHEATGMARNSIPAYEKDKTPIRAHHAQAYAVATIHAFPGMEVWQLAEWLLYGDSPADVDAFGNPFDPSRLRKDGSWCSPSAPMLELVFSDRRETEVFPERHECAYEYEYAETG